MSINTVAKNWWDIRALSYEVRFVSNNCYGQQYQQGLAIQSVVADSREYHLLCKYLIPIYKFNDTRAQNYFYYNCGSHSLLR